MTAADLSTVYRAPKKLGELEGWDQVRSQSSVNAKGEKIDLTIFCPQIVFEPSVHSLECLSSINTSLQAHRDMVLGVASKPLALDQDSGSRSRSRRTHIYPT